MAWTNVFDIGDCTLTVHKDGSAEAMTEQEMTDAGVGLSVDSVGLVTLTAPAMGSSGGGYEVRVTPQFETAAQAVRITEAYDDGIASFGLGGTYFPSWSPEPQSYGFYGNPVGESTIDPMWEFAPTQAWAFAGLAIGKESV